MRLLLTGARTRSEHETDVVAGQCAVGIRGFVLSSGGARAVQSRCVGVAGVGATEVSPRVVRWVALASALVINTVNSIEKLTGDAFTLSTEEEEGLILCKLPKAGSDGTQLLLKSMVLGLKGIQKDYGNEFIILDYKEV